MPVDGGSDNAGVRNSWQNLTKALSGLAMAAGAVVAFAQVYQYVVDGRFNLVLAGVFTVLGGVGVTGLVVVKERRTALIGAAVMLGVIGATVGTVYFLHAVEPTGSFDYPTDNQKVTGSTLNANGRVAESSLELLCIVKDESGNHFPYTAQVAGGKWNAGTGIGPKGDINRPYPFTMILATATTAAMDEIRRQREDPAKYDREGVGRQLPAGITQLAAVPIERTS